MTLQSLARTIAKARHGTKPWNVLDHLRTEEQVEAFLSAVREENDPVLLSAAEQDAATALALIAQPDGAQ